MVQYILVEQVAEEVCSPLGGWKEKRGMGQSPNTTSGEWSQ